MSEIWKQRRRVKLLGVEHTQGLDSRCAVSVRLEWGDREFVGEGEGTETPLGVLRAAATACLKAAGGAAPGISLELGGVKSIRAFDSEVVIASVRARGPNGTPYRLLGSHAGEPGGEPARMATVAVLDALNRILEKYVPHPEPD